MTADTLIRRSMWTAFMAAAVLAAGCSIAVGLALRTGAQLAVPIRHLHDLQDLERSLSGLASPPTGAAPAAVPAARTALDSVQSAAATTPEIRARIDRVEALVTRAERLAENGSAIRSELAELAAAALTEVREATANRWQRLDELHERRQRCTRVAATLALLALLAVAAAGRGMLASRRRRQRDEGVTRLLAAAVRSADEGILISDAGRGSAPARIVYVNDSFCSLTGYTPDEIEGCDVSILDPDPEVGADLSPIERSITSYESTRLETVSRRKDGTSFYADWHFSPVRDAEGRTTHYVSTLRDISERKDYQQRLENNTQALAEANRRLRDNQAQLVQSEKMASLGQLAAGVAHEINNPVGFVSNNLDIITQDTEVLHEMLRRLQSLTATVAAGDLDQAARQIDGIDTFAAAHNVQELVDDLAPMLSDCSEGLARVRDIVKDLTDFSRPADAEPEITNVNYQIQAALKIAHTELKHRCRVTTDLDDVPPISCHPGQLTQVLTNLLVNASQAMLTDHGNISVSSRLEDGKIVVRVTDDGAGISADHMDRLFEPFFTTKPQGQGTGLGLSVSYGIVTRLGGTITADSTEGEGTTFTVRLPVA